MRISTSIVLGLGLLLASGCTAKAPAPGSGSASAAPRVAFVTNGVADFWILAEKGVEAAAAEIGVEATVHMPPDGLADQKRILEDLLVKGVDGIAVSPIDAVNQTPFLDRLAGSTHLITHDSDAPTSQRLCFIGVDNYEAGRMCGELVTEALPDGGKVAIFVGRLEQDNARLRRQGVIDEILGREWDSSRYDTPATNEVGGYLPADCHHNSGTPYRGLSGLVRPCRTKVPTPLIPARSLTMLRNILARSWCCQLCARNRALLFLSLGPTHEFPATTRHSGRRSGPGRLGRFSAYRCSYQRPGSGLSHPHGQTSLAFRPAFSLQTVPVFRHHQ